MLTLLFSIPTYIILIGAMIYYWKISFQPNENYLLAVTLTHQQMNEPEVVSLIQNAKKKIKKVTIGFFLLIIPNFFLLDYPMTTTMYSLVWFLIYLFVYQCFLNRTSDQLLKLKITRGWGINTNEAMTQPELLMKKWNTPIASYWFLPALLLAGINLLKSFSNYEIITATSLPAMQIYIILLCFVLSVISSSIVKHKQKTVISLKLREEHLYDWSFCWLFIAYAQALSGVGFIAFSYLIKHSALQWICMFLSVGSILIGFLVTILRLQKLKQMQSMEMVDSYTYGTYDDDLYWRHGFYRNSEDKHVLVERRIGIGSSMNLASKGGKIMAFVITLICIACFPFITYYWQYDFTGMTINVDNNNIIVDAPPYNYEFCMDDMNKVELINELPTTYKNSGLDSKHYLFGQFRVKNYGQSMVYVNEDVDSYVVVTLDDTFVFLNWDTVEETNLQYEILSAYLNH